MLQLRHRRDSTPVTMRWQNKVIYHNVGGVCFKFWNMLKYGLINVSFSFFFLFTGGCFVGSSLTRSWNSGRISVSWCCATLPTGLRMRTSTATTTVSAQCRFRTRYMRAPILTSRLVIIVFSTTTNAAAFAQNGRASFLFI